MALIEESWVIVEDPEETLGVPHDNTTWALCRQA